MHRVCLNQNERETGSPSGIAILHGKRHGYLVGDIEEVQEIIEVLQSDTFGKMLDLDDERLSLPWLSSQQAVKLANELYPQEYPLDHKDNEYNYGHKFRQRAREYPDKIGAAKRDDSWLFRPKVLKEYLRKSAKRIRNKANKENE